MKTLVLLVATLCCALKLSAQNEWYYFPDEMYFVKEVPVKEFRGKHFKYTIAVNANAADTFSKVRINGVGVGRFCSAKKCNWPRRKTAARFTLWLPGFR